MADIPASEALAATLLDLALSAGAEAADVMIGAGVSVHVGVRDGRLEEAERAEDVDLGLRVLIGRRQAVVSSSDAREPALRAMAARAVAMAREAPEDPTTGLADPGQLAERRDAEGLDLVDPGPEPEPAALEAAARAAEAAARAVAGVTQTDSASASYSRGHAVLLGSNGFAGRAEQTGHSLACVAISGAGTKMERDHDYDTRIHGTDLRSPEEIGRSAGERAAAMQGARRARTGRYPVLFDERISGSLIGHLLQAVNGAMIARGSSWARSLMGEQVLPNHISLTSEPHRPRVAGARHFDAEGLATAPRAIVENGVLRSWVLDLGTARKLGLESTADADRRPGSLPSPSAGNLRLTEGAQSRNDLMREMGTGLLVTSMIGSTINPNTGDYSRGASGFWIENGEVAYPVNEITLAGNLIEMLRTIVPANDARQHLRRVVPSLLVEGLMLAGE